MRSLLKHTVLTAVEVGLVDSAGAGSGRDEVAANAAGNRASDATGLERLLAQAGSPSHDPSSARKRREAGLARTASHCSDTPGEQGACDEVTRGVRTATRAESARVS